MEIVKQKYDNFKAFVSKNTPPNHEHIKKLNELSLDIF